MNPDQEITNRLNKYIHELATIEDRLYEVYRKINKLDDEEARLSEYSTNLSSKIDDLEPIIDLIQRTLDGEDIPIWAEIERFESKQRERPSRKEDSWRHQSRSS